MAATTLGACRASANSSGRKGPRPSWSTLGALWLLALQPALCASPHLEALDRVQIAAQLVAAAAMMDETEQASGSGSSKDRQQQQQTGATPLEEWEALDRVVSLDANHAAVLVDVGGLSGLCQLAPIPAFSLHLATGTLLTTSSSDGAVTGQHGVDNPDHPPCAGPLEGATLEVPAEPAGSARPVDHPRQGGPPLAGAG